MIPSLQPKWFNYATAISNNGIVVGYSYLAGSKNPGDCRAFSYDISTGELKDLNTLIGPSASGGQIVLRKANGISRNGSIVCYGMFKDNDRAFLLTPNN